MIHLYDFYTLVVRYHKLTRSKTLSFVCNSQLLQILRAHPPWSNLYLSYFVPSKISLIYRLEYSYSWGETTQSWGFEKASILAQNSILKWNFIPKLLQELPMYWMVYIVQEECGGIPFFFVLLFHSSHFLQYLKVLSTNIYSCTPDGFVVEPIYTVNAWVPSFMRLELPNVYKNFQCETGAELIAIYYRALLLSNANFESFLSFHYHFHPPRFLYQLVFSSFIVKWAGV